MAGLASETHHHELTPSWFHVPSFLRATTSPPGSRECAEFGADASFLAKTGGGWGDSVYVHLPMKLHHLLGASILLTASALAADPQKTEPDLTREAVDRKLTYNLGATGLRGWIYTRPASHFDGLQGRTTAASRQILVTHVGAKSPADGVMKVDDVILGVGGKLFSEDARKSFAGAIQTAEQTGWVESSIWPSVQLGFEGIDPKEDSARFAVDPTEKGVYPRLRGEIVHKTFLADLLGQDTWLSVGYRYFQEIGASKLIRQADLDDYHWFAAAIELENGITMTYSTGKLPFDATKEDVFQVGFRLQFPD